MRERWAAERDAIKAWVNEHCWSTTKQSYTFYAGSDDLDAATLLAGSTGFDRGERLAGTVAAHPTRTNATAPWCTDTAARLPKEKARSWPAPSGW